MADNSSVGLIDLDVIVATRMKGKKIPRFFVSWLKKFLHQDFLNSLLEPGIEGAAFCEHCLKKMDVSVDVEGLEGVPADGTLYTFVSNHPLGGIDGVTLCGLIGKRFGSVRMLVNDFLMFIKPLAPLCVPVSKIGSQARNLPQLVDEAFASNDQMLIFPAGLCSRKQGGVIKDLPWKKTFVTKSVATRRAVVPVHFIGQNSKRFYRAANWCKRLKLKFNFAMLFLPDEMYRAQHGHFKVIFGKPVPYETFDGSRTAVDWAAWMQEEVYKL